MVGRRLPLLAFRWLLGIFVAGVPCSWCFQPTSPPRQAPARSDIVRVYPAPLSPRNHPLRLTKVTQPPELKLFGSGSACAHLDYGCTGFSVQMYTSSDVRTGNLTDNFTSLLRSTAALANILSPSQLPLYAPNFPDFAQAFVDQEFLAFGFMCDWAFRWLPGAGGYDPHPGYAAKCALSQDRISSINSARAIELMGDRYLGSGIMESDLPGCVVQNSQVEFGLNTAPGDRVAQHLGFEDCTQGFRDNTPVSRHTNWRAADMNIALMTHFYAGYGLNTCLGMEMSANGNMQTTYVWLRGAGRQYGVGYWTDISEFTRFGYKRQDCAAAANTTNPCRDELCINGTSSQSDGGTHCGTSYSLFKRAMLSCILYDSAHCGFADEWGCDPTATSGYCQQVDPSIKGGYLSPIGLIQKGSKEWVAKHAGSLGIQLSTTALLLDYHQGWLRPSDVCQSSDPSNQDNENVWGNVKYSSHDFFTLHALDAVFPGYNNGNLLRNESGIWSPTPHGDTLDTLLIDAHEDVLRSYDTIVVAGLLHEEPSEISRKLSAYIRTGGRVFITFDSLASLGTQGITVGTGNHSSSSLAVIAADLQTGCTDHKAGTVVTMHTTDRGQTNVDKPQQWKITEPRSFSSCALSLPDGYSGTSVEGVQVKVLATVDTQLTSDSSIKHGAVQRILAAEINVRGESGAVGSIIVLGASRHGVSNDIAHSQRNPCHHMTGLQPQDNLPYNAPRVLVEHAKQLLDRTLDATALFDLGSELAWIVKRVSVDNTVGVGEYIIGVQNPEAREAKLEIRSRVGHIMSMDELKTDQSVNATTPGWAPAGYEHLPLGQNSNSTIAGLDMRVFRVRVAQIETHGANDSARLDNDQQTTTKHAKVINVLAALNESNYREEQQPARLLRLGHDGFSGTTTTMGTGTMGSLQHSLMSLPSFKTRFRGIVIDSAFVYSRTTQELSIVGSWLVQNNLTVVVDFSRVINVFPYPPRSFRLYKYMPVEYNHSMTMFMDVVNKLPLLGSTDLVLSLHIRPPTSPNVGTDIMDSIAKICTAADKHGVTVHLRQAPKNDDFIPGGSSDAGTAMTTYVKTMQKLHAVYNLRVALQTGLLIKHNRSAHEVETMYTSQNNSSAASAELLFVGGYNSGVVSQCRGSCDFSQAAVSTMDAKDQAQAQAFVVAATKRQAAMIDTNPPLQPAAGNKTSQGRAGGRQRSRVLIVHDSAFADWSQALDDVAATRTTGW